MNYFVDESGRYLGAWDDVAVAGPSGPPHRAITVGVAPEDARQIWLFPGWGEVPVTVPASVTRRQARLALLHTSKLSAVESAISSLADPLQRMAAQIEYENDTWERGNQWVEQLGQTVGLTPADIDQLFITAANL